MPRKRKPARERGFRQSCYSEHGEVKIIIKDGKPAVGEVLRADESAVKAEALRQKAPRSELVLVDKLAALGFEHSVPCIGFYLDFYHRVLKICIEIDGPHHAFRKLKDRQRDAALRAHGVRTWRFRSSWAYFGTNSLVAYIRKRMELLVPDLAEYLP